MQTKLLWMVAAVLLIAMCNVDATTRNWVGAGASNNPLWTDLSNSLYWSGSGPLLSTDEYVLNFSGTPNGGFLGGNATPNTFTLTTGTPLIMDSLTITFAGNGSGLKKVIINISKNLTVSKAFSIANLTNSGANSHEIDFNIISGNAMFGSVTTYGNGTAAGLPNLIMNISSGASTLCNTTWFSGSSGNSNTSTYIKNSGILTINGDALLMNSGNKPVGFLIGAAPAVTTFNSDAKFDSTIINTNDYTGNNEIILGGIDTSTRGSFVFNGDSIILGYCLGTDSLKNDTLLFNGTLPQKILSYTKPSVSPDRIPGTVQIGSTNNANVSYELGAGDNDALIVNNSLIVHNNSVFSIKAVVIPSDGRVSKTDGLIQVKAGATLKLGTKKGKSSTLPQNYKFYSFDSTSTIEFNGDDQTVYSGASYGNLTITNGPNGGTKTAGGALNILGTLKINSNAVFSASDTNVIKGYLIRIKGNWTNNGTFNAKSDSIIFNGASTQYINGNNASNFYNLIDSNTVILGVDDTIANKLVIAKNFFDLSGHTLVLNGALSGSGTLTGSATSGLTIGGAAGILNFTPGGTNNYLKTLKINASASAALGNALNIVAGSAFGTLTANGTLNSNGFLTLKSDLNGTARVAQSSGSIAGNVTVERFIPARRAWRFLAAPFNNASQTINAAWQEGRTVTNAYACPYDPVNPGYGTAITYNNVAGTGYDFNLTTNPSIKVWVNNAWAPPSGTNISLNSYSAYCLFVRGDRTICLSSGAGAIPNNTILRAAGILNETGLSGNSVLKSFNSAGTANTYMFIGNPYASSIDLSVILSAARAGTTGIDNNKFWVWDPRANGLYGAGGYVAYSNGIQVPPDTSSVYTAGTVIQSGQAFMVYKNSDNSSVSFLQNDKTASETNVFSRKARKSYPVIYTNLLIPSGSTLSLTDGVGVAFGNRFSADVDADDAQKLWNFDENIALVRGSKTLAIEFRPVPKFTDTLFYRLYLRQQPYTLQIFSTNLPAGLPAQAWLVDKYLNTQTEVNLYDTTLYNFTPNPDTNSYRNRFMLVFNRVDGKAAAVAVSNAGMHEINSLANIQLYPNPVSNGKAILHFNNIERGNYAIALFSAKGEKLKELNIMHTGGNAVYLLLLNPSLTTGLYIVNIMKKDSQKTFNLKLIISDR